MSKRAIGARNAAAELAAAIPANAAAPKIADVADAAGDPVPAGAAAIRPARLPVAASSPGARAPAALALRPDRDGDHFVVAVLDAAGADLVVLAGIDEDDIVALWRALGATSGLPLVIVGEDGIHVEPQIGRLRLGPSRARRGHGLLAGRRPRFLVRRKTGRLPLTPQVHRGEYDLGHA